MIPRTHSLIAHIVYNYILSKTGFKLDYDAFKQGNILPDFNKTYINRQHTLEDSLNTIESYSRWLIKNDFSIKDFSKGLGVVCHFSCDYFCLYHRKELWKTDYIAHGIYEINLHREFIKLWKNGDIKIAYKHKKASSVTDIILRLQRKYNLEEKSINTDISYSLIAAATVSEFIIEKFMLL